MTILLVVFTEFIAHLDPSIDEGRRFEKEYYSECPTAEECRKAIANEYNDIILPDHVRLFIDFKQLKRTKEQQSTSPLIIDVVADKTAAIHAFREEIDYWKDMVYRFGGKGDKDGKGGKGGRYDPRFYPYSKGKGSYPYMSPSKLTIIVKFQPKNRRLTWMGFPERHVGNCSFKGWWDTTMKRCSVDHTDFMLEVTDETEKIIKTIDVHSTVLMTHSDVFTRMLRTDMSEKQTGKVVINTSVNDDMSVFDIECILEWMYCGTVTKPEQTLDDDEPRPNAAKMAYFARCFEMKTLQAACIEQMLHDLPDSGMVIEYTDCVKTLGNVADRKRCMYLLMQNRHLMRHFFEL